MSIFGKLIDSVLDVSGDVIEIVSAPAKVAADLAKQITDPVADAARELSDLGDDLAGKKREDRQ